MKQPTMEELRAEAEEYAAMSAGRRRTKRQQMLLAGGIHPATKMPLADNGDTCGGCVHSKKRDRWWKCALVPYTSGPGTDLRVSWPACVQFEAAP